MKKNKKFDNGWEYAGMVGVDSGQVMFCDPCYINSEWEKGEGERNLFNKKNKGKFSYGGCCVSTNSKERYGQLNYKIGHAGAGVVMSSGYGDGTYEVYVKRNEEGRIVEAKIIF